VQVLRCIRSSSVFQMCEPRGRPESKARQRAYRSSPPIVRSFRPVVPVGDRNTASYQFPTDTFSLDPGVGDTPHCDGLRDRAVSNSHGNMVYANGHKLKSIRAFFEGGRRAARTIVAEQSARWSDLLLPSMRIRRKGTRITARDARTDSNQAEVH